MNISEKILFVLSDVNEMTVLPILAALQAYDANAIAKQTAFHRQRQQNPKLEVNVNITIHIVCPKELCFIFARCMPSNTTVVDNIESFGPDIRSDSYDCVFELNETNAREVAAATQRPIAQAYGIIIGSEADTLPDVSKLLTEFTVDTDILAKHLPVEAWRTLRPYLNVNGGNYNFIDADLHEQSFEERVKWTFESKCVMGETCFETYLASALKLPVLEISKDKLLLKWNNPNYVSILNPTEEALQKGIKLCLSKIETKELSCQSQ